MGEIEMLGVGDLWELASGSSDEQDEDARSGSGDEVCDLAVEFKEDGNNGPNNPS